MKKLRIIQVENNNYKLQDEEDKEYNITFEFYDIDNKPEVEDIIYINDELLNKKYEGYSKIYAFGALESESGRSNLKADDTDVIRLENKDKHIYLKRLYG